MPKDLSAVISPACGGGDDGQTVLGSIGGDEQVAENKQNTRPELEIGTAKEIEEMMKKYDRESNVRIWTGVPRKVIRYLCAAFSIYCIWVTLFSTMMPEEKLNLFLGLILVMGYLNYPISKKHVRPNYIPWYDIVIMLVGAIPFFYCALNAHSIIKLAARVTRDPKMVVMAVMAILAYMELCRRCVGIPILCVVGVLLVYAFTNVRFGKVVYDLFYTTTGIMSTPINVCAKYIVVFIIFGAFLERTGISNFFINLANSVAGASSGGPAKVAVISSALCGMVSGSSVGNTVTTGSVTIPMMKKTGYKPEFAGAVEAAASTGGQIMPPIMGAAAFLMAEYMGIPYGQVALKAILPAVLYFTGIYIAVHLEAKKLGLKGIPREELPRFSALLPRVYLLLPLVVLVWLVATNKRTMQFSAAVAIMITILVGLFNNVVNKMTGSGDTSDNLTLEKFVDALEAGAKSCVTVAVACAMAGLVAGSITSTGLASKLITAVVTISRGNVMIALLLTMLCCIVLGMGVPTTANYCIMASTCAPILITIGVPQVAAHFFVFYFGIVADITPPVALAAYAGSAIAKAPPMKTAFNASKLAIAAFIVPYIFALNPAMLFVDTTAIQVVTVVITSFVGMFGVAGALNGFLFRRMNPLVRILFAGGGLLMMYPGTLTDVIGVVIFALAFAWQYLGYKRSAGAAA
ncbi:MAG: TRAP transporter permease [Oscillospiraceae bacterium]|nr:TRAP transporter permease [Oscillospiraceae bacterium]